MIFFTGAITIACIFVKFSFEWRMLLILQARHKHVYESLGGSDVPYRLAKFALFRKDKSLNDPELSRRARELKWLNIAIFVSLLADAVFLVRR